MKCLKTQILNVAAGIIKTTIHRIGIACSNRTIQQLCSLREYIRNRCTLTHISAADGQCTQRQAERENARVWSGLRLMWMLWNRETNKNTFTS